MTHEPRTCPGCHELSDALDHTSQFDGVTTICRRCAPREIAAIARGAELTAPGVARGAALPPRGIRALSISCDIEVPVQVLRLVGDVPHFQRALGAMYLVTVPVHQTHGEQEGWRLHAWCDEERTGKRLPPNARATALVQPAAPGEEITGDVLVCATDLAGDMASVPQVAIDEIARLLRGSFGLEYGLLEDFTVADGVTDPDLRTRFF